MTLEVNRRTFVGSLASLPLAVRGNMAAQASTPAFPIIDTHIHLFDKTRPEGAPSVPERLAYRKRHGAAPEATVAA